MPRIRTIKPTFWKDQKIGKLKREIRLMFIGLWNLADDEGIVNADGALIKAELFPYDEDLRINMIQEWIDRLIEARMIIPFIFKYESYYLVRTFKAHQTINHSQPSKVPENVIQGILREHYRNDTGTLPVGREWNGKEGNGGEGKPPAPEPPPKKKFPVLFRESEIFDKKNFVAAIEGTQYEPANADYYHEVILNWSDAKSEKKINWLATAKNWMAKDMTEGKFITKDFKPPQHGTARQNGANSSLRQQVNDELNKRYPEK